MSPPPVAARAVIVGRVQGVCYRAWARDEARSLGLGGWIRNRMDGSVEAYFEGPREAVEAMLAQCRQGPPYASVEHVAVEWTEPEGLRAFRVDR